MFHVLSRKSGALLAFPTNLNILQNKGITDNLLIQFSIIVWVFVVLSSVFRHTACVDLWVAGKVFIIIQYRKEVLERMFRYAAYFSTEFANSLRDKTISASAGFPLL